MSSTSEAGKPDRSANVVAVIVAYGPTAPLRRCLVSAIDQVRCLVVDNGSDPAVADLCAELSVQYIDAGSNGGFACGVNIGLRAAGPNQQVLLLNPDAVLSSGVVSKLLVALQATPQAAALSPQLHDLTGQPQRVRWPMPSPRQVWLDAVGLGERASPTFLAGTCLLLNARAIAEIGEFDERYFLYAEEADWQRRALQAGWQVEVVHDIFVAHEGAGSSSDSRLRRQQFTASALLFIDKWHGAPGRLIYRLGALLAATRRWVTSSGGSRDEQRVVIESLVHSLARRP